MNESNELIVAENYENHPIEFRRGDGYLNLTALCRNMGKRSNDFMRLPSTNRTLVAQAKHLNLLPEDLVTTEKARGRAGTWLHPKIAIAAARWVSEDFEVWCDDTMKKIVDGDAVLVDTIQPTPPAMAPEQPLVPQTEALKIARETSHGRTSAKQMVLGTRVRDGEGVSAQEPYRFQCRFHSLLPLPRLRPRLVHSLANTSFRGRSEKVEGQHCDNCCECAR